MKITFLGGVEGVTGSRYLIEHKDRKILVDCGMFQGPKEIADRNKEPFPVDPVTIDAIVLTHAHIDHTGYIPALVKNGFEGDIYCSKGTFALCALLLVDSGSIQESDARHATERGGPDHPAAVALYTIEDAEKALQQFRQVAYDTPIDLGASLTATLIRSGHILGSSFVIISDGKNKLTFSGDLGRPQQDILKTPPVLKETDYLVIESTYGDRLHGTENAVAVMEKVINQTVARGGVVVIPCFSVARTEEVLYCLHQLKQRNAIGNIPIFLDGPMAIKIADFYCDYTDEYALSPGLCRDIFDTATVTRTSEESKEIDRVQGPKIIIAGSGMADGGRVMFHLQRFISDPKNTVLFVGYQAEGTRGHALINGAHTIKIHDRAYAVYADIKNIESFSAHADYNEILAWLAHFISKIKKVFVTHGETHSSEALKEKIEERFGWPVVVPKFLESFELD